MPSRSAVPTQQRRRGRAVLSGRVAAWTGVGLSAALWLIPFAAVLLLPVRPYATIVHEGWHAAVGLVTGGEVHGIRLVAAGFGGGSAEVIGGWGLAVAAAGYLGSALTGAIWLRGLGHPRVLRLILLLHGIVLPLLALSWARDLDTWSASLLLAILAIFAITYLGRRSLQVVCALLAIQLCLAALSDLQTLFALTVTASGHNDARLAASMTPIPAIVWATIWGAGGIVAVVWGLHGALGLPSWRSPSAC